MASSAHYEIITEVEYVEGTDESCFGFLLIGASLEYRFVLISSGIDAVREDEGDNE